MISVGHGLLCICQLTARGSPMEIKNHIHSMVINPLDEISNSINIVLTTVSRIYAVDGKPALLVKRYPYNISIPVLHVLNHVIVVGPIENAIAIHALKFCPRVRETLKHNLFTSTIINESISLDMDSRNKVTGNSDNCQD